MAELQFMANLNHYIIDKTLRGHRMIISQLLRDMFSKVFGLSLSFVFRQIPTGVGWLWLYCI